MKISTVLSADLKSLTEALDEPGTDLEILLQGLNDRALFAVESYLGLSMTLLIDGHPLSWTLLDNDDRMLKIESSLSLPLPALCECEEGSVIVLYAANAGAFVDFAADLSYAHGLGPEAVLLDHHLSPPPGPLDLTGLTDLSIINQAVGVLVEQGHSLEDARSNLYRQAHSGAHTVLAAAKELVYACARGPIPAEEAPTSADVRSYNAVPAGVPDALLGIDASGHIDLIDGEAQQLLGWGGAQLLGQSVDVVATNLQQGSRDSAPGSPAATVNLPSRRTMQRSVSRRDGTTFPATIGLREVSDGQRVLHTLLTIRPNADDDNRAVTPLTSIGMKQVAAAEGHREQSQRMESLGELASGVAHDFNNLLGVILNYSVLLNRQITDPTMQADMGEIRIAAERAAVLTRQLLMFSRRTASHIEAIDLNDVVRSVASMLERTLGAHIELRLDLVEGSLAAFADTDEIVQVILNLAINARDAMPAGGRLTIQTRAVNAAHDSQLAAKSSPTDNTGQTKQDVTLRVIDQGQGMTPEVAARAFEPFFTTKPRGAGTGLGLAAVYGIVRRSGGHVTIDSVLEEGTMVTVSLRGAAVDAVPEAGPFIEAVPDGKGRILLVEDEPSLRSTTARILIEHGYQVVVATNGVEALATFTEAPGYIDLVLTDIAMPHMRGDELARVISQKDNTIPIIFMTGYDFGDAPSTARKLTKPITEDTLLRAIRETLGAVPAL